MTRSRSWLQACLCAVMHPMAARDFMGFATDSHAGSARNTDSNRHADGAQCAHKERDPRDAVSRPHTDT